MKKNDGSSEAEISKSIVSRILDQQLQAESEMIERYNRGLMAILYNRCGDKALVDDVAQETWIVVIRKLRNSDLRQHDKLKAFIRNIGINTLIMYRRKLKREYELPNEDANRVPDAGFSPEQIVLSNQLGSTIAKLLSQLSQRRDREIIKRYYLIGDSKGQICSEYKLTNAHFDRVLHRARKRFEELWNSAPKGFE